MIVSFIAILYTRNNIKVQKYIETITNQRIKWIDTLRNDFSDIISGIYMINFSDSSIAKYDEYMHEEGPQDFEHAVQLDDYKKRLDELVDKFKKDVSKVDLMRKIDLSIMRLNQDDDSVLISKLEESRELVLERCEDFNKTKTLISELRAEMTRILKNEWEKVKHEVRKGGFVNVRKQKRFFSF